MATVIFCVFNNFELALRALDRVIRHSDDTDEILVIDDASSSGEFSDLISEAHLSSITLIRNEINLGLTKSLNKGISLRAQRDGIFCVNSDVLVGPKWSSQLKEDCLRSDLTATVTAITNYGTIATICGLDEYDIPAELDKINNSLSEQPPLSPTQICVPVGHCFYISEVALNAINKFDEYFTPGYGEEVDLGNKLTLKGFHHLLSSRVFVYHEGSASFGQNNSFKTKHDREIRRRYPQHEENVNSLTIRETNLKTIESRVKFALSGLTLLIDTRGLLGDNTGTQAVVTGIFAFTIQSKFREIKFLIDDKSVKKLLPNVKDSDLINSKELQKLLEGQSKFDVVFRPAQIPFSQMLLEEFSFGKKLAVLQLDYIAADNWHYFIDSQRFLEYRDTAKLTLELADTVFFNSFFVSAESVRFESSRNGLNSRNDILHFGNGLSSDLEDDIHSDESLIKKNKILVLGTSFSHKYREYAIRLFSELIKETHEYELWLVGHSPDFGGSHETEIKLLHELGIPKNLVNHSSWIGTQGLRELLKSTKIGLLTSVSEGFGLVPGEMAQAGVVCVFPLRSSFTSVYPDVPSWLSLKDIPNDLIKLKLLLNNEPLRSQQLSYLTAVANSYEWSEIRANLFKALEQTAISESKVSDTLKIKLLEGTSVDLLRSIKQSKLLIIIFPVTSKRRKFAAKVIRLTTAKLG